ncbi:MAG TPA: DegQ family serine endoprotease [Candidatus Binatia bacterium]
MRTIRGVLLTLVVGIIIGVGATIWLARPKEQAKRPMSQIAAAPTTQAAQAAIGAAPAPAGTGETIPPAPAPLAVFPDFASLAERLSPSVVNISTTSQAKPQEQQFHGGGPGPGPGPQWPFGDGDPREFGEPFDRFFGPNQKQPPQRAPRQRSLGSGFIVATDGEILTNNHVVENADEIIVRLDNGKEYKATLLGKDAKTDIALLRIENVSDLKAVTLGDSDSLRVGEWVMAIGNPFGLDHTVTSGIVSAKGRFIGAGNYDDYIQTDAAINPGNSGGPLLNLRGEVVGINSAIFSRTGGNIGIGFAVPINIAKELVPQLKDKGKVTRGWLGVLIQKITPDIAQSLGIDEAHGALVADVVKDGPALAAGLKVGDVIVEFDGHPVHDSNELPLMVARTPIGKTVSVKVLRDKDTKDMSVTIAELKDEDLASAGKAEGEKLGLTVQTLTPEIAQDLGVTDVKGVVVTAVESGGAAEDAGLRRGDIILEVNRQAIEDVGEYRKQIQAADKTRNVLFLVRRGDNTIFLAVKPSP